MPPNTIKALREQHCYTQFELARELGISRQTLSKYENGITQPKPEHIKKLAEIFHVDCNCILLNEAPKSHHYEISPSDQSEPVEMRINIPQKNIEKFKQVFLYILQEVGAKPNIGQTVLYKLLYFIDFDYYELYEEQLMGLSYIKNTYGPTPVDFTRIIREMESAGQLEEIETKHFNKRMKKYIPIVRPDLSLLTGRELESINTVLHRHSDKNATEISAYSHLDVPWIITADRQAIDYESVFYRTPETSVRQYPDEP